MPINYVLVNCKMPSDSGPITSTPVKSEQIIIMLSQEQPVSSDESVTIDVVNNNDNKVTNLYDIPLDEMSIEIVDDLSEPADAQELVVYFNPPTDEDQCKAAMQFNLKIGKAHVVNIQGWGNKCGNPPYIHTEAKADGLCLFNSVSILLTGSQTYSAIICHVVCNYISNPVKHPFMKMYILSIYKTGKEYIVTLNMHNYHSWGTKVEIMVLAQISGFNFMVYTKPGSWL